MLEAYGVLNHLAACTQSISLGPLVASACYRHPSVLIKGATTLDVLGPQSSYFGVGAGWYDDEARGLGIPFPDRNERYILLEETIQIAKYMWSGDRTAFTGRRFALEEPISEPQPLPVVLIRRSSSVSPRSAPCISPPDGRARPRSWRCCATSPTPASRTSDREHAECVRSRRP